MTEFITNCALPLAILFLVIGFVFLVKGADIFVEGSSSIAKKFKVPSIIIGLTIVAMGTSLPGQLPLQIKMHLLLVMLLDRIFLTL